MNRKWTIEEDNIIRQHWLDMTDKDIGKLLNRSENAVQQERHYTLGLRNKRLHEPHKPGPVVTAGYRGTPLINQVDAKEIKHVNLLKRVYGTYGGAR